MARWQVTRRSWWLRRLTLSCAAAVLAIFGGPAPATAVPIITLPVSVDVTYSVPSIVSGPLSFGLGALPATVLGSIVLEGIGTSPSVYDVDLTHVSSFSLPFGDSLMTEANLTTFTAQVTVAIFAAPDITLLTFDAGPRGSSTANGIVQHNSSFSLTLTGTDIASGQPFEYFYAASSQRIVPEPGAAALFGLGLTAMAVGRRKRT